MRKKENILYKIYPSKTIERIDAKIKLLGPYSKLKTSKFLNDRVLSTILIFLLLLIFSKYGYFLAPCISLFFYLFIERIVLDYQIKKRAKKLDTEAIFFFEVLELTIESSHNLKSALSLTSKSIDSELALEFRNMLDGIKLGKSFTESLKAMKERIPSDSVNNIILSLIQSSIYGSSIIESLNNQLDYLKEKRLLDIKAEITKLPTKISIISVVFFIPILLLVILSPVIINFLMR